MIDVTVPPGDHRAPQSGPVDAGYAPLAGSGHPSGGTRVKQLWELLPSGLAGIFRPKVLDVTSEVIREIQRALPDYARTLEGEFGKTIIAGVQQAIQQFLDRLGDPAAAHDDRSRLFYRLGQHEMQRGRTLDVLQTAYRVGARVAWRRLSEVGTQAGIPTSTLCLLAEAIFAYIDELSALSIAGHAAAQESTAGTQERRRRRLMDLILAERPASPQAIEELAAVARWTVPEHLAAVALEPRTGDGEPAVPSLGDEVLMDLEGSKPCLIMPYPDAGLREQLGTELAGWRVAIGPRAALDEAAQSLRHARQALGLVTGGVLPDEHLTWCEDHLFDLWLFHDTFLIDELTGPALAPLANLPAKQARRLANTLLGWLETRGNVRQTADLLSVHPQTVRARVQELESLFGNALQDPEQRFQLIVALRAGKAQRSPLWTNAPER